VCGTLIGAATAINIQKLKDQNNPAIARYVNIGRLFTGNTACPPDEYLTQFIQTLNHWIECLKLPRLSNYGVQLSDIDRIVKITGNKNNPVKLDANDIKQILLERL
jgi:alcohol dehydrogenase